MGMGVLLALGLALLAQTTTRIGLALNVPEGGGEEEFLAAMRQQVRLGLDGGAISLKWDEWEEKGGKPLTDSLGALRFMGQDGLVTVATIDTLKRRLPSDVAAKDWSDPLLVSRWERFLGTIAGQFGPKVKWVSLGNEVDGYLSQHPGEVDAYIGFLARGREAVRKVRPDIQVGVTVMCMDGLKHPDLVRKLQTGMDVTVFTYYPLDGLTVHDPAQLRPHFDFMTGVAGARPLLLQEIGYPASEKTGSSEEKQARFVRSVFGELDRLGSKVPLAAFFMQVDFPPSMTGALEEYYGIRDPAFLAFLQTLGLFDSKGRPRLAWAAFKEEATRRKPF
jgi:hypothetical protein